MGLPPTPASASARLAAGAFASTQGSAFSTANGFGSQADFEFGATATGAFSNADAAFSTANGFGAQATGLGSTAVGTASVASGPGSVAVGVGALAVGTGDTAVGAGANVQADNGSSFGSGATVNNGHTNSSAFGTGASTTNNNQMMFGTAAQTYTTPGITSGLSKARQTDGPLEVVTRPEPATSPPTAVRSSRALSELNGGVAIAMALSNPDLVGNESSASPATCPTGKRTSRSASVPWASSAATCSARANVWRYQAPSALASTRTRSVARAPTARPVVVLARS